MRQHLAQRIEAGCVVVTPNRRLAAHLRREYDALQLQSGRSVWPSADCLPYDAWLERAYRELTRVSGRALLLAPSQELALWEKIIAESREARPLMNTPAAARQAREAWRILHAFRIELTQYRSLLDEDGAAFAAWSSRYRSQLDARGLTDGALLADAVAAASEDRAALRPQRVACYAFDDLTLQQRALMDALAAAGWTIAEIGAAEGEGAVARTAYPDAETEFLAVAARARALLEASPAAHIGVIVPDLQARRAQVIRVFDDVLEPARVVDGSRDRPRPFNVSLGAPLTDYPLVHAALLILSAARSELALAGAGALLRSPFIAGAETEMTARALLDARLRERGALVVPLEALVHEAQYKPRGLPGTPLLGARLERWLAAATGARRLRQLPSAWSATFQSLLGRLGWPGERALDSEEFQTFDKWREVVGALSILDLVAGPLKFEDALSSLRRLAADTLFQPESEAAPVQILGILEANALEFEHLFVTGLNDEALPASPRPNPFLPISLQRRLGVPHASAEWEVRFARRALASWRVAAPQVHLSWPQQDGDRELRASPLLAEFPEACAAPLPPLYRDAIHAERAIGTLSDYAAPQLAPGARVAGGASFFKNQADCPFRAFAVHRLGARALETGHPGLDARERGSLVHEAAAHLWREVKSHARLDAMGEAELAAAAERAAAVAVNRLRGRRPDAMTEAFGRLERSRVARLLAQLLRLEKLRAPFEVAACEERRAITLGGVELSARVDRVDRLENGARVILDYKTGNSSSPSAWLGERPDEPQLPLYAVTDAGEVGAVAFAALNAKEVAFKGISRGEGVLPDVAAVADSSAREHYAGWQEMLIAWRGALERLAAEYLSGAAPVAPKQYPRTCEYCDIKTFCRVRELLDRGPVPAEDDRE